MEGLLLVEVIFSYIMCCEYLSIIYVSVWNYMDLDDKF